jgi:LysR family glycine cleavage system transcriptional activator
MQLHIELVLHAQTVDMAIRYGRGNYSGLVTQKLFSDAFIPVCSPSLLQGDKPLQVPEDLTHHTLLHSEWINYTGSDQPTWQKWLTLAGITTINLQEKVLLFKRRLMVKELLYVAVFMLLMI